MYKKLTYEYCENISSQYKSKIELQKKERSVYNKILKKKWFNLFNHMENKLLPKNSWTYERCKEEALKYKTRQELQGKTFYQIMRKNNWLDELTKHIPYVVKHKYWSHEKCKEEALKYRNRREFQKKSPSGYGSALRNKWLDEICSHMGEPLNKKRTKEEILTSALKYQNQRDWVKNDYALFICGTKHKKTDPEFWEKCISHMQYLSTPPSTLTYEMCDKLVSNYTTLTEFIKKEKKTYRTILRKGWNEIISNMDTITKNGRIKRYSSEFDSLEKCKEEALNYNSRTHLNNECPLLYKIILKNNWEKECFSHMGIKATLKKRFIYSFEFTENKVVYVGLTCDINRRIKQHYGLDKGKHFKINSKVYNYMVETNLTPIFKQLTEESVDEKVAGNCEDEWIKYYKDNGWKLLNIAKAGSLGGRTNRDFEYYQKIRNECKTISEFSIKLTIYDRDRLRNLGWWDTFIIGLEIDRFTWTLDSVYQEYPKYKGLTRSQLQKKASGLYKAVVRLNLLDELFPIKNRSFNLNK